MKYILLLTLLATTAQAQVCYDSSTQVPCPTINNGVSTSSSVRAGQLVFPTQPAGVTPTAIKGTIAMTNGGDTCLYNGSTWIKLNAVNIISGLSLACVF